MIDARLPHLSVSLLACCLASAPARGQTLATGELGSSTRQAVEARSRLAWGLPIVSGTRFALTAGVDGAGWIGVDAGVPDTAAGYAAAIVTLSWKGARDANRAWVRLGTGGAWDRVGGHTLVLDGLGGSLKRGPIAIELSLNETRLAATDRVVTVGPPPVPVDTPGVPPAGPTTMHEQLGGGTWRDVRAQLSWTGRLFEARVTGGAQLGGGLNDTLRHSAGWLRAEATAWLTPQVGVVLGVGNHSTSLLEASPPTGPVTLALRVAFGRASKVPVPAARNPSARGDRLFQVRSLAGDLRALRVRVVPADHVELTADFLDWGVLSLAPAGAGVWEARVAIPPGSHRVSIRVDGGPWIVPPGLPAIADDFTGTAGLLRVE